MLPVAAAKCTPCCVTPFSMRMNPPPAPRSSVRKERPAHPRVATPVAFLMMKPGGVERAIKNRKSTMPSSSPESGTPSGPSLS